MCPTPTRVFSRRRFITYGATAAAAAVALAAAHGIAPLALADDAAKASANIAPPQRYRIAACDWMMLKRQKLGAFQLAKDVGLDGLEVDMGGLGDRPTFDNKLTDPTVRQQFLDASKNLGIEICSIAMSGYYAQAFAEREGAVQTVRDTINTMQLVNAKIAFLPLGVRGDLVKHPELRPAIVERLKAVAPDAEKAGVIIGLETALDAAGDVKLLDEIGSKAVRIYFNFANALQAGRDVNAELRTLGKDRICQIHCTDEDGYWLQDNKRLDMPKVKQTLDDMGWSGWLVIERSRHRDHGRDVKLNFSTNAKYLKSVFQS
jgi:sugar phosphate isomerase/epimerase